MPLPQERSANSREGSTQASLALGEFNGRKAFNRLQCCSQPAPTPCHFFSTLFFLFIKSFCIKSWVKETASG